VKVRAEVAALGQPAVEARLGARILRAIPLFHLYCVQVPQGLDVPRAIAQYRRNPAVVYAEPNYLWHTCGGPAAPAQVPNDPDLDQQWAWDVIHAPQAWDKQIGSREIVVAVIDTGVDYNHKDLQDNIWTNPGEIPGNNKDDDNNGYKDDVHGINVSGTGGGEGDPMDDNEHGTHVSGTIGAVGNNGKGGTGVNWEVSIMGLKFLDSGGTGSTAGAVECLAYATMMKQKGVNILVTNNSWGGGGFSRALKEAFQAAADAGMLHCCAAGNGGADQIGDDNDRIPEYPSSYDVDEIVAVAASTEADGRASFSNYGKTSVDLAAPGVRIYSTIPGNRYDGSFSGTSMATPHVSGAAALLWAQKPGLSPKQVKKKILKKVDKVPAWNKKVVSNGRLSLWPLLNITGATVEWMVPPPAEMKVGEQYPVSWKVVGEEAVEATYVAYDHSAMAAEAESATAPQTGEPGVYQDTLYGSWGGTYYFTPVAQIDGVIYYGPTIQARIRF
jgi:subtilisin family serine protease